MKSTWRRRTVDAFRRRMMDDGFSWIFMDFHDYLVGGWPTPLKNIGISQLGWLFSIYGTNMFQTTNQMLRIIIPMILAMMKDTVDERNPTPVHRCFIHVYPIICRVSTIQGSGGNFRPFPNSYCQLVVFKNGCFEFGTCFCQSTVLEENSLEVDRFELVIWLGWHRMTM